MASSANISVRAGAKACALSLLGAFAAAFGAQTADAQTIVNTATAEYAAAEGERVRVASNTVRFAVAAPTAARLTTFVPMPRASQTAPLRASYCSAQGGGTAIRAASGGATDVAIQPTGSLRVGQTLVLRIDAPQANIDAAAADTLELRLSVPNGDRETLTAIEDRPDSGVFYATIRTTPFPPAPVAADCRLSVQDGERIDISGFVAGQATPFLTGAVDALADPFGTVFDSLDGAPVDGARVTIIDIATGLPAEVFSFDGVTPYPSTVTSGGSAEDASGLTIDFGPGEYRFPLLPFGSYRLRVEPPSPYEWPSEADAEQLASLTDAAGLPYDISSASYGAPFTIDSVLPVQVDVPVDAPGGEAVISKRADRELAEPGDTVFYTVAIGNRGGARATRPLVLADQAATGLRFRPETLLIDGSAPGDALSPLTDGSGFTLALGSIAAGAQREVTYAFTVREDAPVGHAMNRAIVEGPDGSARANARIRILRDGLTDRMTIIGRVVDGACGPPEDARGIPGVRVMLEDGSFTLTDADGRYHFEGVVPGNHVVQVARFTLPEGGAFVDCVRSSRSQGSAISRLVDGGGGSLVHADFHARLPDTAQLANSETAMPASVFSELSDAEAAGAETDYIALGDGPDGFLFPAADHNPRAPAIRVAIRHRPGQIVDLALDGDRVRPLSFDGATPSADGAFAVSLWRGLPLDGPETRISATIRDASGAVVSRHERIVHYATTPFDARIVPEQSELIADGATRPVLAVRLTDRRGRPVHAGVSGSLSLADPYQAASALDAAQSRELTGFGNGTATWTVTGDDGIALIPLAPTMVSGRLTARFAFVDGETAREREIEAWIEPGDQPWTLIGLAEGSIGARSVAENMERAGDFDSDLGENARVALYAKGRVLGRYLLTVAYDSAKQEADQRLLGTIDPAVYYTVFGDNTQRLFDAASRDKLYIRVESAAFYALYGDFLTGFDQTLLARYQRIATGVKGEARTGRVVAQGFAARIGSRSLRDEIQGQGISGPYRLSSRQIVPNSETVVIETRDRLRSELVLEQRVLTRFVDYDIDPLSGTISFAQPVLSRDAALNPVFIVIDYDSDRLGDEQWNAGLRAAWTSENGSLRVGATGLTEKGDSARGNLGAVDMRLALGADTELRGEIGYSDRGAADGFAYAAEIEHHSGPVDLLAYVRQVGDEYGVGQQNLAEQGRRKIGLDARYDLADDWVLAASAWHDESLVDDAARDAAELRLAWRAGNRDAFVGIAHLADTLSDGTEGQSTVLTAGGTQRLLDDALEITAATSLPLGATDSIDLPTRHNLGLRYAVTRDVKAIAAYEIARGDAIDAQTLKFGAELTPWEGGKLVGALGRERFGAGPLDAAADADRTFAAFTLGHGFRIGERLRLDATVDANRTLDRGIALGRVVNPAQPVASGGQFGPAGSLGEDFAAITFGAAWSAGPWNARGRAEYRDGQFANRFGIDAAVIRQLGDGSVAGGGATWTRAENATGGVTEIVDAALSVAHRPADSELAFLGKLEYRGDAVTGAIDGLVGAAGQTALLSTGEARSRRLVASLSTNWTPADAEDSANRTEISLFTGARHNFDRFGDLGLSGTSLLGGIDARIGVGERFELGGRSSVRHNLESGTTAFAIGPEVGFVPTGNVLVSVGYNIIGFRDPDFREARATDKGLFATLRIKFDDDSFRFLGLGR